MRLDAEDHFVVASATLGSHPFRFAYNPITLWRVLGRDVDVLDLHEEPGSFAAAQVLAARWVRGASSVPIVFYSAQNILKRYPPPFRWFERRMLRVAKAAYVCNTEAVEVLRRKGFRGPVDVIPLGVEDRFFAASGADAESRGSGLVVGFVGRLDAHKGVEVLLEALTLLSDASLQVVGDGPRRGALEQRAASLGVRERVEFLGAAERKALPAIYRQFDVLAVPSLPTRGWKEQFGRVAAEAMGLGVPIVASASGSLPDVVGPGGLVVEPGDARALADALRLFEDAAFRTTRSAAAREWAEQFRWEAVAAQQLQMYRRVVASR